MLGNLRHIFGVFLVVAVAILANRYATIDFTISAWFYDTQQHSFPLRENWLWSAVFHEGLKWLAVGVWLTLLLLLGFIVSKDLPKNRALIPFLAFTLLVSLTSVMVVAGLKSQSMHSCPWSLESFGGSAQFFRIGDAPSKITGPGRCLPSGHATVGFMWIAAIFASRHWLTQFTGPITITVLSLGLIASGAQIVRGAHFFSHVLLTAAVCWAVAWIADRLWQLAKEKTTQQRLSLY